MGVDYFNCDVCSRILCDGGDYETFQIRVVGYLKTCCNCGEDLRSKLLLVEPWTDQFLAISSTGQRLVCKSPKAARTQLTKDPATKFGLYRSSYGLSVNEVSAWTGTNVNGDDLLITTLDKITNLQFEERRGPVGWGHEYHLVGWYKYYLKNVPSWFYGNGKNGTFELSDKAIDLEYLRRYAEKHGLTDRPVMITHHNSQLMTLFCDPDSIDAVWFDSLEEAKVGRWSSQYVVRNSDLLWKPTQAFIDERIHDIKTVIADKQKQLDQLSSIYLAGLDDEVEDDSCESVDEE